MNKPIFIFLVGSILQTIASEQNILGGQETQGSPQNGARKVVSLTFSQDAYGYCTCTPVSSQDMGCGQDVYFSLTYNGPCSSQCTWQFYADGNCGDNGLTASFGTWDVMPGDSLYMYDSSNAYGSFDQACYSTDDSCSSYTAYSGYLTLRYNPGNSGSGGYGYGGISGDVQLSGSCNISGGVAAGIAVGVILFLLIFIVLPLCFVVARNRRRRVEVRTTVVTTPPVAYSQPRPGPYGPQPQYQPPPPNYRTPGPNPYGPPKY